MFSLSKMPSTTSVLSTYTTLTASAILVKTLVAEVQNMTNQLIPKNLQDKILSKVGIFIGNISSQITLIIEENNGITPNEIFEASKLYLGTIVSSSAQRVKISKAEKEKKFATNISKDEKIIDIFEGVELIWELKVVESQKTNCDDGYFCLDKVEKIWYELSFIKSYKEMVMKTYLPFVLERSKAIKEENKVIKLSPLGSYGGECVNLDHPSTFDTLAMDPEEKKKVIDDLQRFISRRDYYRRVGKAWKRGYLLYGPPGTGKSSLIAAMANYLKFDIYDLELSSMRGNADFRRMLVSSNNKSIIVIEDIDCTIQLHNRDDGAHNYNDSESQVTLSGLLNFIDGLWSSCGDERIIVFTTNFKERLDPALIRPGRMDMHIHMSYCTPSGFKILASNYLGLEKHYKFREIEELITEVNVTPAEIAEELMKSDEADIALDGLIKLLNKKKADCKEKIIVENEVDEKIDETNKEEIDTKETRKRKGNSRRGGRSKRKIY
ncbi:AAA-ATPase At3g50940-like [Solanum stenotomum]|uniref:AAA-ATPase At3g50940-like n=1 Tax=Solanum stenotomum TaxID=172797 RepID=UPI0020D0B2ED|nr:AAA-ATPase At3g50940-like [Solanum stenotomum]